MIHSLRIFFSISLCTLSLGFSTFSINTDLLANTVTGIYPGTHSFTVNRTTEYIISYTTYASIFPTRITSLTSGHEANMTFPIMVVVRQQKGVTSWQLPLGVDSMMGVLAFRSTSRTLCHTYMDEIVKLNRSTIDFLSEYNNTDLLQHFSTSVSTSSYNPLDVTIITEEVKDFYVHEHKNYTVVISPSEPHYYYYKFLERNSEKFSDTVVLEVDSEDETCFYVSIQDPECPVYDLASDITAAKLFQTVNKKGGLTIGKFEFPNGFFIVFVAKSDNYDCSIENSLFAGREALVTFNQTSVVNFKIRPSISIEDYIKASLTILAAILIFYVLFLGILYVFYAINKRQLKTSISIETTDTYFGHFQSPMMRALEIDMSREDVDSRLKQSTLYLSDLAKRSPNDYNKKSLNYCWQVLIAAIFYSIPVVQLVITYQRILNISGNQDLCYYNFLCANPLLGVSDFNHIFSNIGYVFAGMLFLLLVFIKDKWEPHKANYGIPKHYGLYYAMGVAMIIEGVLSACYHICPNQANFQFDTSFMYVLAVLCIVKLYQKRHPDINAVAYATFLVLGVATFIASIGIINGSLAIWIIFMVVYIIFCSYLSFNTYFLSYVKRGLVTICKDFKNEEGAFYKIFKPRRRAHFIICFLGTIINTTMALMGIYCYLYGIDFGSFLLAVLLGNALLYCICYTCMKLSHGERICSQAIFFGVLSIITWGSSVYFFTNASTMWYVSPAESRQRNTNCKFLNFYDDHDLWHLLSAPALFFTFVYLMVLDDDINNKPHFQISVF